MAVEFKIEAVYIFGNGMCAVFDQYGDQIPEMQGVWEEKKEAIFTRICNERGDVIIKFQ